MRITTRGRYALRASVALARLQTSGPISIKQLANEEHISSVFLEQIFFNLRKAGLVKSARGPGGGFQFVRTPEKISLLEILDAAGEETNVTDCDKNARTCDITGIRCSSHSVWEDITAQLRAYFGAMTLAAILEKEKKLEEKPISIVKTKNAPDPVD